jgi:hypothetical protein
MTENIPTELPKSPRPAGQDAVARPAPGLTPPPERRDIVPALYLVGFLVLGAALIWLWWSPSSPPASNTIDIRLDAIEARLAKIESAPKPSIPDIAPALSRLAALETRPAAAPATDVSGIETRLADLESRPKLAPPDPALASELAKLSNSAARTTRLQAAAAALDAGEKLGPIPGAPLALQVFANTPPPTYAGLRLAFAAASQAALAASRPADADLPVWQRYLDRAQALVTIRRGTDVLVGDPAAGVIAIAKRDLDAGDLAGAVNALAGLNPAATQAMSAWLADARALLAARAALTALAVQP